MRQLINNRSGFTVFEMLVSLAIVSSIAAIFIVNVSRQNREREHITSIHDLGAKIRTLQNWALSSNQFDGDDVHSWFIYMNRTEGDRYYIYADLDGNLVKDPGAQVGDVVYFADNSTRLNILKGERSDGSNFELADNYHVFVFFYPPDSRVRIDVRRFNRENDPGHFQNYPDVRYVEIFFQQDATGLQKSATINRYGLFEY